MKFFKNYIEKIQPYEPGKPIEEVERELGLSRVIKLASNENPLGPSPKALRAMTRALKRIHLYPDGGSYYLKERLARELGVSTGQLIIGNGSNEIIELLARGFLREGDRVVSSDTSFLVYPLISKVCGAEFVSAPLKNYRYDLNAILKLINDKTKLIFISNPNNPTGTYVTRPEIENFLSQVPRDVMVCFDEAYFDFVDAKDFPDSLSLVKSGKSNVILLRTFSKSYGLAGLRVGYGIANPELISYLDKVRQPFNVNRLAQIGAAAALDDKSFLRKTKKLVQRGRLYLYQKFDKMNIRYISSQANFILFDAGRDGTEVFQALLKKGIIVRDMKAYGLPKHIRVTVGKQSENEAFIRTLQQVLK